MNTQSKIYFWLKKYNHFFDTFWNYKMKILIVGADDDNAIERYYVKYLSKKYFKENLLFFKAKNIFNN